MWVLVAVSLFWYLITPSLLLAKDWKGVCYSPCGVGDTKGVHRDIRYLSQFGDVIRTYSTEGCGLNDALLDATRSMGMKVYQGVWIGPWGPGVEIAKLEGLALARKLDNVEAVIVGSETLYRGDVSEEKLIEYIHQVRALLQKYGYENIKVTTAETRNKWSARLISEVDLVLSHMHPYWEYMPVDVSADAVIKYAIDMKRSLNGKPIVIGETGWPDEGDKLGAAIASPPNQAYFYSVLMCAAKKYQVDIIYFEGFDSWFKGGALAEKHWGIFTGERRLKPHINTIRVAAGYPFDDMSEPFPGPTPTSPSGTPSPTGTPDGSSTNPPPVNTPPIHPAGQATCRYDQRNHSLFVSNLSREVRCVVFPAGAQKLATERKREVVFTNIVGIHDFNNASILMFTDNACSGNLLGTIRCTK